MNEEELNRRKTICALLGLQYGVTVDNHWVEKLTPNGGHIAVAIGRCGGQLWEARIVGQQALVALRNFEEVVEKLNRLE